MSSVVSRRAEGGKGLAAPIFIVGSPRSGTSLLRLILDSHPAIACGPETHILSGMGSDLMRFWRQLERYGWSEDYWYAKYREFFSSFKVEYMESKGKRRWADKTPGYARHLPFIVNLFPDAQVIHVIRDARMVTASVQARWGWRRAWDTPEQWVTDVTEARGFGDRAPEGQYTEVRFEQLVRDPESVLMPLFAWLGEDWEPGVLDYDRYEHDESPRNRQVRETARASTGRAIDSRRATTERQGLDPLLRARVKLVAGGLNTQLGYR